MWDYKCPLCHTKMQIQKRPEEEYCQYRRGGDSVISGCGCRAKYTRAWIFCPYCGKKIRYLDGWKDRQKDD